MTLQIATWKLRQMQSFSAGDPHVEFVGSSISFLAG
jgi:hypothetical protein